MIARIPKAFKDCLKENLLDIHFDTTDTFVKKIVSNKKAKFIYRSLIDKIVQNPTEQFLKWEELLQKTIFTNANSMKQSQTQLSQKIRF